MTTHQNLTLIGTSHIAIESIKEVKKTILEDKPDIVAIELDRGRLLALMGKKDKLRFRDVRKLGVRGFLFAMFGAWISAKLGKLVGTKPGDEMKAAVISTAKIKSKLALIDQEISVTLKKLFKKLTWREMFRFVGDLIKGAIFRKPEIEPFDLRTVPKDEIIEKMVGIVRKRYPSVYDVLIEDRNKYMAKKLIYIMKTNPDKKVVAIIGAGHKKGILEILEKATFS